MGLNNRKRNVAEAIRLARECDHEEARWLADLFPEEVKDERLVLKVLRSQKTKREMCRYLSFLPFCRRIGYNEVHLAAVAGYAPAQAWMAKVSEGKEKFKWASKSAAQHEPEGLWHLALCYRFGHGCEENGRASEGIGWIGLGRRSGLPRLDA